MTLIIVGVSTFLLSAAGFIFSASEHRPLIMIYGGLSAALAIGTISTVFLSMLARSSIVAGALNVDHRAAFEDYNEDPSVRGRWDYLQTRLRCCGSSGYENYHVSLKKVRRKLLLHVNS